MGISRVILETDALNLRDALLDDEPDDGPNGALIHDARLSVLLDFAEVQAVFSPTGSAHELAKFGASLETLSSLVWLDDIPEFCM